MSDGKYFALNKKERLGWTLLALLGLQKLLRPISNSTGVPSYTRASKEKEAAKLE